MTSLNPMVTRAQSCTRRDAIQKKRKRLEDTEASCAGARAWLADGGAQRSSLEARVAELLRMQQVSCPPKGSNAVHQMLTLKPQTKPFAHRPVCVAAMDRMCRSCKVFAP